jgi:hypothetical protein
MTSLHRQVVAKFAAASKLITASSEPPLSLGDLDHLVAGTIFAVIEGQCGLFHVVRASLEHMMQTSQQARLLHGQLCDAQLPMTILRAVRRAGAPESGLDKQLGIPPFGMIAAHLAAPLFVGLVSPLQGALEAACALVSVTGEGGGIDIELQELAVVLARFADDATSIEYRTPMCTLETIVALAGSIQFRARLDGKVVDWQDVVLEVAEARVARERKGNVPTSGEFMALVETLEMVAAAAARRADTLGTAGRGAATVSYVGNSGGAFVDGPEEAAIFFVRSPSAKVPCSNAGCTGFNPPGSLVCTTCVRILGEVYQCAGCNCPVRLGGACKVWFCSGGKTGQQKAVTNPTQLKAWAECWTKRYEARVASGK